MEKSSSNGGKAKHSGRVNKLWLRGQRNGLLACQCSLKAAHHLASVSLPVRWELTLHLADVLCTMKMEWDIISEMYEAPPVPGTGWIFSPCKCPPPHPSQISFPEKHMQQRKQREPRQKKYHLSDAHLIAQLLSKGLLSFIFFKH